ncbi:hypothetical protein [Bacillus sp. FJAT-45066]|uniref:hypothetical protein n=1 Tax=Bacillus sp. FJAT-45066 TaxID=2011010 RepID=UPI000BB90EEC|nr:hypothetical protein [Bacillus sp. FJAT-45066]
MTDTIISLLFICMFFSPFLYLHLKKKRIAAINGAVLIIYFISWIYNMKNKGLPFEMNIESVIWITSLLLSVTLLITAISLIFYRISPKLNRYLIPAIILFAIVTGGIISHDESVKTLLDTFLVYTAPICIAAFIVIGTIQWDRKTVK